MFEIGERVRIKKDCPRHLLHTATTLDGIRPIQPGDEFDILYIDPSRSCLKFVPLMGAIEVIVKAIYYGVYHSHCTTTLSAIRPVPINANWVEIDAVEKIEIEPVEKGCKCDIMILMQTGCRCGAIRPYN